MANILSRTYLNSHLTLTIHDIVDNVELSLVGHSTIPPSSDMGAGSSTMLPAQTIVSVNVTAASDESTEPKVRSGKSCVHSLCACTGTAQSSPEFSLRVIDR